MGNITNKNTFYSVLPYYLFYPITKRFIVFNPANLQDHILSQIEYPKAFYLYSLNMKVVQHITFVILLSNCETDSDQYISNKFTSSTTNYFINHSLVMEDSLSSQHPVQLDTATFGAGCFWCVEAQFQLLEGVIKVESGYAGGHVSNPTYKEVCTGTTGHAEVCNIYYDPTKISYEDLLQAFWQCHDPTQLNRQGNDIGPQYRSVIFYHNQKQKELAEWYKKKLNEEKVFERPIVTEISPFINFYKAEDYHQNYYRKNPTQPYCELVIKPKIEKFQKVFKNKLKYNVSSR